jgi:ATP-dependent DNA ligase
LASRNQIRRLSVAPGARLFTRNGYDWTKHYPWIVEAALKNRIKQFVIDGEAVILGVDGRSDFDAVHSGKHRRDAFVHGASQRT